MEKTPTLQQKVSPLKTKFKDLYRKKELLLSNGDISSKVKL